ncbi:MAG: BamA/TamA family outer membrane protein [Thermodesulfovibrionales bacterium]|nr:BamA/TamA family outer membrane protein [Thermodesulfovibrionales bacterium]
MKKAILLLLCSMILTMTAVPEVAAEADSLLPDRRRPQFTTDPGYIIIPAPYSIEGIGEGVVLFGTAYNVADTYTDVFGAVMTGDIEGVGAGFTDYHIIDKRLFLDITYQDISKVVVQSYSERGMDTSGDDYTLVEIDEMTFTGGRLILSFEERMFEMYVQGYDGSYSIGTLKDPDGNLIADASEEAGNDFNLYGAGMVLDLTDDNSDPREGIRMDTNLGWSPPEDSDDVDYVVLDNNLSLYVPVGKRNTWVFNYFSSDAFVQDQGETDPDIIMDELGFDCSSIGNNRERKECEQSTAEYVDNVIAANRYGTASSLGGRSRLRSYPEDRFKGAHTAFLGTEFRWNITEESTPVNLGIIKDIRTGVQAAFFYEIGSVAESAGDVWQDTRASMGAGLRVVNASGLIYRFGIATGDEGEAVTLIINYPWEAF